MTRPRSMVTRQSLPGPRSIWRAVLQDLGNPPTPGWRDFAVAGFVLFVLCFAMSVGYEP